MTEYNLLENGNTTITKNVYDVNNLRISKNETSDAAGSIDQPAIRFVYDGQNILFDDSTFYLNNIMINSYEAEISVKTSVYLKDAQGSVRGELYDSPITINTHSFSYQTYDYTAFGEQIASNPGPLSKSGEGETNSSSSSVKEGISYTGHYFDSESKLYYARARFLDPSTGRFITQDPIQDPSKRYGPAGLNRYVYGLNNPVTFWDPYGEDIWSGLFMGASMGQVSSTALGDDVMSNVVGAMFEAKDSSYQGVSLYCYNYVNEQVNPNYEEFIGIDLGFVKYGYGKSKNEGYYIEEGSSLEVNLAPIGAPVYFGGGVDFKHSYTYRTETFNWNVNAGIGIGDPKFLQVGAGLSFGGTMERSLNGDEYDRMWKSQSEYIGTNAGVTVAGVTAGVHAQWNYGEFGEYEGMNYGFGLSYGYSQQTGYNQGFDIGAGMDWYYDKNGNYRGRTESGNIGYGFTDYAGWQASATIGYLDGQQVGSLNSNFYFDPAKLAMRELAAYNEQERQIEEYKNLLESYEYNLANPLPETPEVAAEFSPNFPQNEVAKSNPLDALKGMPMWTDKRIENTAVLADASTDPNYQKIVSQLPQTSDVNKIVMEEPSQIGPLSDKNILAALISIANSDDPALAKLASAAKVILDSPVGKALMFVGSVTPEGKVAELVAEGVKVTEELEAMVKVVKAAEEGGQSIKVIGRLPDTAVAKDWAGHNVLDIPDWSIPKNDAWVNEGIKNGQDFYTASPLTPENLWDSIANRETVYGREIRMLQDAGYVQKRDYFINLNNLK